MAQTSKRPQQQQPQLQSVPKTPEGQRLAEKIKVKEQEWQEVMARIQKLQQGLEQTMRAGINLEGQLTALKEELEEAERVEPVQE